MFKEKYNETYFIYETAAAQILEQIQQGPFQIPQAPVTSFQKSTSYGCRLPPIDKGFLRRLSSLANFLGPFHGEIHWQNIIL